MPMPKNKRGLGRMAQVTLPGLRASRGLVSLQVERGYQGCLSLGFRPAQAQLVQGCQIWFECW